MDESNEQLPQPTKLSAVPRKGFRNAPKPTKADQLAELQKVAETTAQSLQLTQQYLGQFVQRSQKLEQDLGMALGAINDLQYRLAAVTELTGFTEQNVTVKADTNKLADYEAQAAKADAAAGLLVGDVVTENSILTVSSIAPADQTKNVFRSRFRVSETGSQDMISKFVGHRAGDQVEVMVGPLLHKFTIHSVREDPAPVVSAVPAIVEGEVEVDGSTVAPTETV